MSINFSRKILFSVENRKKHPNSSLSFNRLTNSTREFILNVLNLPTILSFGVLYNLLMKLKRLEESFPDRYTRRQMRHCVQLNEPNCQPNTRNNPQLFSVSAFRRKSFRIIIVRFCCRRNFRDASLTMYRCIASSRKSHNILQR